MAKRLSQKAVGLVTAINLLGAAVALAQTIVIAQLFGATRVVEIFFAATTFQTVIRSLSNTGNIGAVFTPIYYDIKLEHGLQKAVQAFWAMTNVTMVIVALVVIVCSAASQQVARVLVPGFAPDEVRMTGQVVLAVSPVVILNMLNAMLSVLLRAQHHYGVDEALAAAARVCNLIFVILFGMTLGIWALVIGVWIAAVIRLSGQSVFTAMKGYWYSPRLRSSEFRPLFVLRQLPWTFSQVFSTQFLSFAITASLSFLPEGGFAVCSYARRMIQKFQGIILKPIGTIHFNQLAHALAEKSGQLRELSRHALALTLPLIALIAVPMVISGDLLLNALWGSEDYSWELIKQTNVILVALTLALTVSAQHLVLRNTNLALRKIAPQYLLSGLITSAFAILSYWAIPTFGIWGLIFIHVGNHLFCAVGAGVLVKQNRPDLMVLFSLKKVVTWFVAGGVGVLTGIALRELIPFSPSGIRIGDIVFSTFLGAVGIAVTMYCAHILRVEEVRELQTSLANRFRRGILKTR